jgi:hypothetical protein
MNFLLSTIGGFFSAFQTTIIAALASLLIGGYFGWDFASSHYDAKMARANEAAQKEKNDIQRKGDQLVVKYIDQIKKLSDNNSALQRQIPMAVGGNNCVISSGFIRVYNASASNQASSPSGADGTPSALDPATLLGTLTENNEKYNKLASQLTNLQEFVKTK